MGRCQTMAANRPMRHPAPTLLAHAALAWLLAAAGPAGAQPQGRPATVVEAMDDAVIFRGRIDARSAAQVRELLRDPGITRLVIGSGGGDVAAALDIALAVHERQLDVEVPRVCHSSCANYIFPAGRRKSVGRPGAVAWHGNMTHALYLHQTGQAVLDPQSLESARALAAREAQFYRRIGVDGFVAWFAKLEPYQVEDFYALSAPDMERFGIREVTVPAAPDAGPDQDGVRMVRVDWSRLEADRPAVRLAP